MTEAQAALRQLRHPNMVTVYSVGAVPYVAVCRDAAAARDVAVSITEVVRTSGIWTATTDDGQVAHIVGAHISQVLVKTSG